MSTHSELPLLSSKSLPTTTTESALAAYNNVHDLLATVHTQTQEVVVYRITNGQTAFTIKRPSEGNRVTAVKWKADGSLVGVAWVRGACGVYSGESGKLIAWVGCCGCEGKRGEVGGWRLDLGDGVEVVGEGHGEGEESVPSCLGWTAHLASSAGGSKSKKEKMLVTTESWFDDVEHDARDASVRQSGIEELTDSITTLDVTKVLPRLSAIPSHGVRGGSTVFTSRTSTDSIFDASKTRPGIVDTLITSTTSGYTQVLLDDSLNIGSFDLRFRALKHASHPKCNSQVILSETAGENDNPSSKKYRLHYIDLPLDTLGSAFLHTIAANTKRMQNLTEYIKQTVHCIQHDFETGLQLPSRFLNSIKQELAEKADEGDVVTNLYELALGGRFTPTMLEWLTDIVKETNHKRWDQAVNTMYANIQNHLFVNLLPALDRTSIAASALRGQARFHEGTTRFEVEPDAFTAALDAVDSIRLVAKKMELVIMTEHRQFRAFSKWMRVMIEIGVAGPGSKGAVETEEREMPNLDYGLLLEYIKTTMTRSRLVTHIELLAEMSGSRNKEDFFAHPSIAQMKRENTMQALKTLDKHIQEDHGELASLVNLPALTAYLAARTRLATDAITSWQRKMIPEPTTYTLRIDGSAAILDLRLFPTSDNAEFESFTDILTTSKIGRPSNEIHLYRITRLAEQKLTFQSAQADFVFEDGGSVVDGRMLDEEKAMVLFKDRDGLHSLLECDLQVYETQPGQWVRTTKIFVEEAGWVPERFLVGGRVGKRVVVVFGVGCREWRVFDLDGGGDRDVEGGGFEEGEEMVVG